MAPCLAYKPWQSVDPARRYCLVDTMVLLQLYRRDRTLAAMAEAVLDGRALLVVPSVVGECYNVFNANKPGAGGPGPPGGKGGPRELAAVRATREDLEVEPGSRDGFDCLLVDCLSAWGAAFAAVEPGAGTLAAARRMKKSARYGPLSPTDCLLLRLAVENPNVDVLTDDKDLARAIASECGRGRASNVFNDYFGRLNMTARFLSMVSGLGFVDCRPARDRIEYYADDMSEDETGALRRDRPGPHSPPDRRPPLLLAVRCLPGRTRAEDDAVLRRLKPGSAPGITRALLDFVDMVVLDWYCACGDPNLVAFDGKWARAPRGTGADARPAPDARRAGRRRARAGRGGRRPYYDAARGLLREKRNSHCACARPDERRLHEAFRDIVSEPR